PLEPLGYRAPLPAESSVEIIDTLGDFPDLLPLHTELAAGYVEARRGEVPRVGHGFFYPLENLALAPVDLAADVGEEEQVGPLYFLERMERTLHLILRVLELDDRATHREQVLDFRRVGELSIRSRSAVVLELEVAGDRLL